MLTEVVLTEPAVIACRFGLLSTPPSFAAAPRTSLIDGSRPVARMSADRSHSRRKRTPPDAALDFCTRLRRQRLVSPWPRRPQLPRSALSWTHPSFDFNA